VRSPQSLCRLILADSPPRFQVSLKTRTSSTMSTSPHLQLSTFPRPHDFISSLADTLSSTSVLSLTPSTQSPSDSPILPMSLAVSLPPELLLDIFSCFSNSPSEISSDEDELYLERNRNLKSFALVHTKWTNPAQETLRKEIVLCAYEGSMNGMGTLPWGDITQELSRKTQILVDAGVRGTQYLTVYGRLDAVISVSGMAMWDNVKDLSLHGSSRSDGTTSLVDFAGFPCTRIFLSSTSKVPHPPSASSSSRATASLP